MGANKWNSVSDLSKVANDTIKFYLSNEASDLNAPFDIGNSDNQFHFSMSTTFPSKPDYLEQKYNPLQMDERRRLRSPDFCPRVRPSQMERVREILTRIWSHCHAVQASLFKVDAKQFREGVQKR